MLEMNSRPYAVNSESFMKPLHHTPPNIMASPSDTTGPYKKVHSHINTMQISQTSSGSQQSLLLYNFRIRQFPVV